MLTLPVSKCVHTYASNIIKSIIHFTSHKPHTHKIIPRKLYRCASEVPSNDAFIYICLSLFVFGALCFSQYGAFVSLSHQFNVNFFCYSTALIVAVMRFEGEERIKTWNCMPSNEGGIELVNHGHEIAKLYLHSIAIGISIITFRRVRMDKKKVRFYFSFPLHDSLTRE